MKIRPHKDFERLKTLFPAVREYQKLAQRHGIGDVFQDNGGKILQVCLALGLRVTPSRMGNDAIDRDGNEYELKSVNLLRTPNFSTHHHLNMTIVAKYRLVSWIFATYEGIELREIYLVTPAGMEDRYRFWLQKLKDDGISHINNPKVPLTYVQQKGRLIFSSAAEGIENTNLPLPFTHRE